jgi:carbon starvation protein
LAAQLAKGALPPEQTRQLIFNQYLDAGLTLFFVVVVWVLIFETLRLCLRHVRGLPVRPLSEAPHQRSRLAAT